MNNKKQFPNLNTMFRDEDDIDFLPSAGSNLAAIFETSEKSFDVLPSIARPTSQKKAFNEQNVSQSETEGKTEVVIAKAIHAFKLQNGQYVSVGQLGIALTKNSFIKINQILLYQNKQQIISTLTITQEFSFTIQKNNYCTYYDTNQQLWSIAFENKNACIEFAREVGLSRYFCRGSKTYDSLIYQDLTYSDKTEKAKEGDQISVKYAIAIDITQPMKISALLEQRMTVDISLDDNWERLLCGTCKELRKILILPPSKQISLGPGFPKERDIILEVEIIDITTPIKETTTNYTRDKSSLLLRMAKMGHSLFPKQHISATDSEDTEDEVQWKSVHQKKLGSPGLTPRKKQTHVTHESSESLMKSVRKVARLRNVTPVVHNSHSSLIQPILTSQWSPTQVQPQYTTMEGQLYSLPQQNIIQPIPMALDPNLNIFLSETRTQNTEIRMGISKVADNVQKLLDKFHLLEIQNTKSPSNTTIETTMLLALNKSHKDSKINSSQISTALTDEDNLEILKLEIDHLKEIIKAKESELKNVEESLQMKENIVNKIENEKEQLKQTNSALNKKVSYLEILLNDKKDELNQLSERVKSAKAIVDGYQNKNTNLKTQVDELINQLKIFQISSKEIDAQQMLKEKNKAIRMIMNKTYRIILEQFTKESYTSDFIKEIVGRAIRDVTLEVLKEKDIKKYENSKLETNATKNISKKGIDSNEKHNDRSPLKENISIDRISISSDYHDEPPPISTINTDVESD